MVSEITDYLQTHPCSLVICKCTSSGEDSIHTRTTSNQVTIVSYKRNVGQPTMAEAFKKARKKKKD